jgi:hypothetical protein
MFPIMLSANKLRDKKIKEEQAQQEKDQKLLAQPAKSLLPAAAVSNSDKATKAAPTDSS